MTSRRLIRSIFGDLAQRCGSNYFAANPDHLDRDERYQ